MSFNEAAYDALYERVDAFMKRVNPCKIKGDTCHNARHGDGDNFCCDGCSHLGTRGCLAIKPLTCRVWLCQAAMNSMPIADSVDYVLLYDEVHSSGFFMHRASKDEVKTSLNSEATR
jgi:hypothetical protein